MKTLTIRPVQDMVLGQVRDNIQNLTPEQAAQLHSGLKRTRDGGWYVNRPGFGKLTEEETDHIQTLRNQIGAPAPQAPAAPPADPAPAAPAAPPADPAAAPAAAVTPSTGGIWNTVKNWLGGDQGQAPAEAAPAAPQALGAQQLSQQLSQAIKGFGTAYNAQIRTFNPAIAAINKVVQGLASQQGSQMLQFNPQMSGQIQQLVTTLTNATQEEAMDQAFISQLAQQADALAKAMYPQTQSRAAMTLTAGSAMPTALCLK